MGWLKLDDNFAEHPKIGGLSLRGFKLHVRGLCYAARHLTDGLIPSHAIKEWGGSPAELIDAGLWAPIDQGYLIHDFLDYNPSRRDVLLRRESDRKRKGFQKDSTSESVSDSARNPGREKEKGSSSNPNKVSTNGHRARNEFFDAVVEVCHYDPKDLTKATAGHIGSVAAQLREVGATPPLIRGFEDVWANAHPDIPVTPGVVAKHWPDYMAGLLVPLRRSR